MGKQARREDIITKRSKKIRVNNCINKKTYNSEVAVMAAALVYRKELKIEGNRYYYKCVLCKCYHITKREGDETTLILC